MSRQLQLFKDMQRSAFGGSLLKNSHAKKARPFSAKASMHVVLKARSHSLRHYDQRVEKLIEYQAKKHFVRVYRLANPGNHIHLVLKAKSRILLSNFLRSICGLIARLLKISHLWAQRPFSRILRWGREFKRLQNYISLSNYEAQGYSRRQARFMLLIDQGLFDLYAG